MDFRTALKPLRGYAGLVDHHRPVVLAGSCFSDNVGARLEADLFDVRVNPFGPLYNPLSLLRFFRMAAGEMPLPARICCHEGCAHSYDAHSRLSEPTPEATLARMAEVLADTREALCRASAVIVTLGTTRVFTLRADGETVANCHKQPAAMFSERNITLAEATEALTEICSVIRGLNPEARTVFTVSPLRYPSPDPHANTLAKSTLHLAVAETMARYGETVLYFPAYEAMMDDLRDYRFYADDMRHPSDMAVGYIYDLFAESFFSAATLDTALGARRLTRRLAHRGAQLHPLASLPEYEILKKNPALEGPLKRFMLK